MIKHLPGCELPTCIKTKMDHLAFDIFIKPVDEYSADFSALYDALYDDNCQIKTLRIKNLGFNTVIDDERWDIFYNTKILPLIKDGWTEFYDTSIDTYENNLDYLYVIMIKNNN